MLKHVKTPLLYPKTPLLLLPRIHFICALYKQVISTSLLVPREVGQMHMLGYRVTLMFNKKPLLEILTMGPVCQ